MRAEPVDGLTENWDIGLGAEGLCFAAPCIQPGFDDTPGFFLKGFEELITRSTLSGRSPVVDTTHSLAATAPKVPV